LMPDFLRLVARHHRPQESLVESQFATS
jgi:hypothetical protein